MKRIIRFYGILLGLVAMSLLRAIAVTPDATGLSKFMDDIRSDNHKYIDDGNVLKVDPNILLSDLKNYEKDENVNVRRSVNSFLWKIAVAHPETGIRKEAVQRLVAACNDTNAYVWRGVYKWILCFSSTDFTPAAKASIHKMWEAKDRQREMALLMGVANMPEEMPKLRELLFDELTQRNEGNKSIYSTTGWATRLALARMGSKQDIVRCIEVIETEPDPFVQFLRLQHHLAYIRQPEVIPIFRRFMDSDYRVPNDADAGRGSLGCYRTLDILAHIMKNFPVSTSGSVGFASKGYSEEQLNIARKWMKNVRVQRFCFTV
jgi:hypothetical protein